MVFFFFFNLHIYIYLFIYFGISLYNIYIYSWWVNWHSFLYLHILYYISSWSNWQYHTTHACEIQTSDIFGLRWLYYYVPSYSYNWTSQLPYKLFFPVWSNLVNPTTWFSLRVFLCMNMEVQEIRSSLSDHCPCISWLLIEIKLQQTLTIYHVLCLLPS